MDVSTRTALRASSQDVVRSWVRGLEDQVRTAYWLHLMCPSKSSERELRKWEWVFHRLAYCYTSRMLSLVVRAHPHSGSTAALPLPQLVYVPEVPKSGMQKRVASEQSGMLALSQYPQVLASDIDFKVEDEVEQGRSTQLVHVPDEPEAPLVAQKMSKRELALHFLRLQKEWATLLQRRAQLEGALDRAKTALSDAYQELNMARQGYSSAKQLALFEYNSYQERVAANSMPIAGPEQSDMVVRSLHPQLLAEDALSNLDMVGFAPNSSFDEASGVQIEEVEEDEIEQAKLAQILWIDENQLTTMDAEQNLTNQKLEQEIEGLRAAVACSKRQTKMYLAQADYLKGQMQRLVQLGNNFRQQTESLFRQQIQQVRCVASLQQVQQVNCDASPYAEAQKKKGLWTRLVDWVRKK